MHPDQATEVMRDDACHVARGSTAPDHRDLTPKTVRGRAYGARQALDTAGAVVGPLLAIALMGLFAGDMRGKAEAGWVQAALASMARTQGAAAKLLQNAHAMTDVTGFGLAGHLGAICEASGAGASLKLSAIPLLPGAAAVAARGIRSTLWEENRRSVAAGIALPAPAPPGASARV